MGLFKALFPNDLPIYTSNTNEKHENLGMIEGLFDFDGISITQSQAKEKAKTELKRIATSLNADAIINVRMTCLTGQTNSTVVVYGDAIKYIR